VKFINLIAELSLPRIFFLSAIATVAYFLTYFNNGTTIKTSIEASESTVSTEMARRVGIEKIMKKEEEMRGNILQLARNLEVVKSKIPFEFKDTEMSTILNSASETSGINVLEMSSSPNLQTVQNVAQVSVIDARAFKPEDMITEVKFNIALAGSYVSFLKFLDVLTKENKIIKVRNFTIEKSSTNVDDDTIKFKGEVIGYKQAAIFAGGVGTK